MDKCEKLNPDLDKLPKDKYVNTSLRGEVEKFEDQFEQVIQKGIQQILEVNQ